MGKSISDAVLTNLAPRTYYRACDVAKEMGLGTPTVGSALRELARGG